MKTIRCTIWILGALLVIATLDALPDPPAMDPHTVKAKASCLREYSGEDGVQYLSCGHFSCASPKVAPGLPTQRAGWADGGEPNRTTGGSALVRHAADSSPPVSATS
jgi:hypothetical protein